MIKFFTFALGLSLLLFSPLSVRAAHDAPSISVLTLNVWALPEPIDFSNSLACFPKNKIALTEKRDLRLRGICRELKKGYEENRWDVVFLQEIWLKDDQHTIEEECGFPYRAAKDQWTSTRLLDSGLMILSRYPFEPGSIQKYEFKKNGSWKHAQDFEKVAHKSILAGKILFQADADSPVIPIWATTAHFVSTYPGFTYEAQRLEQFQEALNFIGKLSNGNPLILGGDFNVDLQSTRSDKNYDLLVGKIKKMTRPSGRYTRWKPSKEEAPCTACPENIYNGDGGAGFIDSILATRKHFKFTKGGLVFNEPILNRDDFAFYFLSDHYGVESTFEIIGH